MHYRHMKCAGFVGLLALLPAHAMPAAAATPTEGPQEAQLSEDQTIQADAELPESEPAPEFDEYPEVPEDVYEATQELGHSDRYSEVSGLRWDPEEERLEVRYYGDPGEIEEVLAASSADAVLLEAEYPIEDLIAYSQELVSEGELLGETVSWAAPLPDASGIEVALDVDDATLEDLKAELQEDPDLSPVPVPVELIAEQRPQPAQ